MRCVSCLCRDPLPQDIAMLVVFSLPLILPPENELNIRSFTVYFIHKHIPETFLKLQSLRFLLPTFLRSIELHSIGDSRQQPTVLLSLLSSFSTISISKAAERIERSTQLRTALHSFQGSSSSHYVTKLEFLFPGAAEWICIQVIPDLNPYIDTKVNTLNS